MGRTRQRRRPHRENCQRWGLRFWFRRPGTEFRQVQGRWNSLAALPPLSGRAGVLHRTCHDQTGTRTQRRSPSRIVLRPGVPQRLARWNSLAALPMRSAAVLHRTQMRLAKNIASRSLRERLSHLSVTSAESIGRSTNSDVAARILRFGFLPRQGGMVWRHTGRSGGGVPGTLSVQNTGRQAGPSRSAREAR
jgi:hypothetical protein